ncbi:MAG: PAS domain-containing sensor histidine kinase [Desulfobulbaceae bacterium A2]|nr:MAG: PAS domain-containing sensor histidine kinase [Desulfobulbaceae bacterium A2]
MNSLSMLPSILIDIIGSAFIILFCFLALRYAYRLSRRQPDNVLWAFLFFFCLAMAAFAISRAMGHLVKQFLLLEDQRGAWQVIAPYSGGFNTLLMISVSAITIYYRQIVRIFRVSEREAGKLKGANQRLELAAREMQALNLRLEEIVEERTRELSSSEKKFRHFFANSKDMVYFCAIDQRISDMNDAGREMLGYHDVCPLHLRQLLPDEQALADYLHALNTQGFIKDLEIDFVRADGSRLHVLLSATAIYDPQGKLSGCEGIAKDLTRVKNMMQQLVDREKMASIGEMAAGVAHEINTPLGIILGYAQLMLDDFPPEGEVSQNLRVIERQTKACRKIVADLLKFSRQVESVKEQLDPNEILIEVLAVTEHNLNLSRIQVERRLTENLPPVIGDLERLRQVFVNLINNAHHAMAGGGILTVTSHHDMAGGMVVVAIADTGPGIPKEIQGRIFDPFFTTKSVGQGTGLGLSVSYGIIRDHGGTITAESPAMKRPANDAPGTVMRVLLPVASVLRGTDEKTFSPPAAT